jgi:hypothetical protein
VVLENCTIRHSHNSAISIVGASPAVIGCFITDSSWYGIETRNGSAATVMNCTMTANSRGGLLSSASSPKITNCIIWDNGVQEIYLDSGGTAMIVCSDVEGGWSGKGNIDSDPLLTADGHLQAGSPCIDAAISAGAPSVDIDGELRPFADAIDIGADEFTDSDGDTLPDRIEVQIGTNPNDCDTDGDGMRDGDELFAGTNPTDQASLFSVVDIVQETQGLSLAWTSIPGRKYAVYESEDLVKWSLLEVVVASSNVSAFVSAAPGPGSFRFYRIQVLSLP